MFIYLDVIRVSKKCSPYVFKMFRRPYGVKTSINACFRVFWVCGSCRDGL